MRPIIPRTLAPRQATRTLHTSPHLYAPKPSPDKSHHVLSYPSSAFPSGYAVSALHSGIKKKASALDLGILISTSPRPTSAAACLTRNVFKAAPVTVSSSLLASGNGRARGFVVNSGCANAVTGKKGLEDAWSMSSAVTSRLPPAPLPRAGSGGGGEVGTLVMSTGVIGQHLPIDNITNSIPSLISSLSSSPDAWMSLARAFMTTDTFPKLRTRSFTLGDRIVKFAGIDKGAGMIAPNMGPPGSYGPPPPPHATLLGVIATDAAIAPEALQAALNYAVDRSFNSITVDGDMSTNDSIIALANGAAGLDESGTGTGTGTGTGALSEEGQMQEIKEGSREFQVFREELRSFAEELAQLVVRDGEGATKFVTVRVQNAPSFEVANAVAKSVASSSLVKCAMYGEDANWGRILCAVGYTALPEGTISPTRVTVSFVPSAGVSDPTPLRLLTNGEPEANIDEARASVILAEEDLEVVVDLGEKEGAEARVWTCDFSHEYVTINGDYRS